jgi:hypothetical protein
MSVLHPVGRRCRQRMTVPAPSATLLGLRLRVSESRVATGWPDQLNASYIVPSVNVPIVNVPSSFDELSGSAVARAAVEAARALFAVGGRARDSAGRDSAARNRH